LESALDKEMQEVLDRHLPKDYSEYTFDAHQEENTPLANREYITMHNAEEVLLNRESIKAESQARPKPGPKFKNPSV